MKANNFSQVVCSESEWSEFMHPLPISWVLDLEEIVKFLFSSILG